MPLGLPHGVGRDVTILGYTIPKGSVVMPNIYCIHRDPELWDEPTRFNPDRWLDADNKIIRRNYFMPFSLGITANYLDN